MSYRVSWDIDINDAASPLDAARKAHEIVRRRGTSANVYNVEAPDGVVTVVDLEAANGPKAPDPAPSLQEVLAAAESFISGFEGDEVQEGVDQLLADIRAAMRGRTDRQIVDETNALARYMMAELVGTGYQVADTWRFHEETDPRSRKAWKHAVAIMEMITFTDAEDALSNLDPAAQDLEDTFAGRVNYAATVIARKGGQAQIFDCPDESGVAESERKIVTLTFVPEAWVNDYAVVVDPEGRCEWPVLRKLFLEKFSTENEWNERHQDRDDMRFEGAAPAWVRSWAGPFEVELVDDPASVWPALEIGSSKGN